MKKNHRKTIWGTSNFINLRYAIAYYATQGENEHSVKIKIKEGSISIGAPKIKPSQKLSINNEGRYFIETN